MTWKEHRNVSVTVFIVSMTLSLAFYVVLLRNFGALPDVRKNRQEILELQAKVDSLLDDVKRIERSNHGQGSDR